MRLIRKSRRCSWNLCSVSRTKGFERPMLRYVGETMLLDIWSNKQRSMLHTVYFARPLHCKTDSDLSSPMSMCQPPSYLCSDYWKDCRKLYAWNQQNGSDIESRSLWSIVGEILLLRPLSMHTPGAECTYIPHTARPEAAGTSVSRSCHNSRSIFPMSRL
jgi:hypothetical protein